MAKAARKQASTKVTRKAVPTNEKKAKPPAVAGEAEFRKGAAKVQRMAYNRAGIKRSGAQAAGGK